MLKMRCSYPGKLHMQFWQYIVWCSNIYYIYFKVYLCFSRLLKALEHYCNYGSFLCVDCNFPENLLFYLKEWWFHECNPICILKDFNKIYTFGLFVSWKLFCHYQVTLTLPFTIRIYFTSLWECVKILIKPLVYDSFLF